jgi:hypothetical protein
MGESFMKKIILLLFVMLISGCNYRTTNLPEDMPEDFSFSVHWEFDGYYDSKTMELKKGYNYDLECECKTQLEMTNDKLKDIYRIIRNAKVDSFSEEIRTKNDESVPSANFVITIQYGNINHTVKLLNSFLNDDMNEYLSGKEVGIAIKDIIENYIINTDEFKSLPENQLLYD